MTDHPEVVVAQDLDQMECGNPHCPGNHPLFFHPNCHPDAGVDVSYVGDILSLQCHTCRKPVLRVRVARAELQ